MIKQLLNSVFAKYRDLSVSRTSNICLSLRLRQITDLLASDKSRYFAQARPITVKYPKSAGGLTFLLKTPPKYRKLIENKNKNAPAPLPKKITLSLAIIYHIIHPFIFARFYWLLYVTWSELTGQLSRIITHPLIFE